jgi:glycogen synthase
VFRHRERGQIYSFQDEDEMLTWLAVFNQAVAAVVIKERLSYMQLHDYHGGLSLMYIPERLRPAVLYVAHNAHYDATFPIPTPARRNKIYEHLNLNAEQVAAYAEHNGRFDILRSVVMVLRNQQQGHGVVAVSPRYAKQIKQKLSVFWQLSAIGRPRSITGILNALDMGNSLASQSGLSAEQVADIKRAAKLQLQERYGLAVGDDYKLLVFVGRITHQKGCDIIAEVSLLCWLWSLGV